MSDIVERLRAPVWPAKTARRALCDEAAAEIERLRVALLEAVSLIEVMPDEVTWSTTGGHNTGGVTGIRHVETRLRAAISGKEET